MPQANKLNNISARLGVVVAECRKLRFHCFRFGALLSVSGRFEKSKLLIWGVVGGWLSGCVRVWLDGGCLGVCVNEWVSVQCVSVREWLDGRVGGWMDG